MDRKPRMMTIREIAREGVLSEHGLRLGRLATVQFINADNKLKKLLPAGDAAFVAEGAAIPEATVGLTSWTIARTKSRRL